MADIKTMWLPGALEPQELADTKARAQLKNKLDATALPEAINTALAQAKESGEFDGTPGDPGYTPVKGKDYFDGEDGISPTVAVSNITGGHRIAITDKSGTRTVDVMDGEKGDPGYTPVRGVDYWTPEDKASVVADVLTILDASAAARVVVDTDNNITLSGDLANGTYTLRYENTDGSTVKICDMTVTDGTADPDVPDEPSVNYTNLVPTALTHTDTTTVFNAAGTPGYMDGKYASSAAPFYGNDSTTVCTGLFSAGSGSVYYIKGVTFDESNIHFRFGFAKAANATISTYKVADPESMRDAMTVEELGTQYYKVTVNASYVEANWPDLAYMWFSAVGTGENLIVTANEPIE